MSRFVRYSRSYCATAQTREAQQGKLGRAVDTIVELLESKIQTLRLSPSFSEFFKNLDDVRALEKFMEEITTPGLRELDTLVSGNQNISRQFPNLVTFAAEKAKELIKNGGDPDDIQSLLSNIKIAVLSPTKGRDPVFTNILKQIRDYHPAVARPIVKSAPVIKPTTNATVDVIAKNSGVPQGLSGTFRAKMGDMGMGIFDKLPTDITSRDKITDVIIAKLSSTVPPHEMNSGDIAATFWVLAKKYYGGMTIPRASDNSVDTKKIGEFLSSAEFKQEFTALRASLKRADYSKADEKIFDDDLDLVNEITTLVNGFGNKELTLADFYKAVRVISVRNIADSGKKFNKDGWQISRRPGNILFKSYVNESQAKLMQELIGDGKIKPEDITVIFKKNPPGARTILGRPVPEVIAHVKLSPNAKKLMSGPGKPYMKKFISAISGVFISIGISVVLVVGAYNYYIDSIQSAVDVGTQVAKEDAAERGLVLPDRAEQVAEVKEVERLNAAEHPRITQEVSVFLKNYNFTRKDPWSNGDEGIWWEMEPGKWSYVTQDCKKLYEYVMGWMSAHADYAQKKTAIDQDKKIATVYTAWTGRFSAVYEQVFEELCAKI